MNPRIALPLPTHLDLNYNRQNWPAYADAIRACGGEPVEVRLDASPRGIAELANSCQAVVLPGSPADVNPGKYAQAHEPGTAPADLPRENVDELLIQDAHNLFKPLLCICFGAQILNVWRSGTLVQDLTTLPVNHSAARGVAVAHTVAVPMDSLLASMLDDSEASLIDGMRRLPVNSSHHQAVGIVGDGLRVSARCPQDGVAEAIEGGQASAAGLRGSGESPQHPEHFVLGLQWHPERTFTTSATSRRIFERLVAEAARWQPRPVLTSVVR